MIGKIIRGARVAGLTRYLYGPGERNEHVNPHVIAGFRHPAALEPGVRSDGTRDLSDLNRLLNQPLAVLPPGTADDKPVWHCALRAAPDDPILSDDAWADIAHQVMHHLGLAKHGDEEAVRWAAIRHADDHIHIVATLARQDGTKPRTWNDFRRLREACNAVEKQYGLRATARADRTAARRPTRAESELTQRQRRSEEPRVTLRRAVASAAVTSANEAQFFTRLRAGGLLVRERFSQQNPGEVTGFAVALPDHMNRDGRPIWFGGGRLAPDLTLPRLRHRWATRADPRTTPSEAVTQAIAYLRMLHPGGARTNDVAWATADVLRSLAAITNGTHRGELRPTADVYDRAARPPYGRIPQPTPASAALRAVARALSYTGNEDDRVNRAVAVLLDQLAALADTIAYLRATQNQLAQAEAAAAVSDRLRHMRDLIDQHGTHDPSRRAGRHEASQAEASRPDPPSAVAIAQLDFPCSPTSRTGSLITDPADPTPSRVGVRPPKAPHR